MTTKEQTNKIRNIRSRISADLMKSIEQLNREGHDVPSVYFKINSDDAIIFNRGIKYTKTFDIYLSKIEKKYGLNLTEKGIINTLIKYIAYEDNLLRHPTGLLLKRKDMEEILGIGHNAIDKHLSNLVKKGVLAKVTVKRTNQYYLNPYIAYRGKYIDKTLLNMFKHTVL